MRLLIATPQKDLEHLFKDVIQERDEIIATPLSQAIETFSDDRYDAVMIDVATESHALSSKELEAMISEIRNVATRRWIPILMLAQSLDEKLLSNAFVAGADDVILLSYPVWLLKAKLTALNRVESIQSELQVAVDRIEQMSLVDVVTQLPNYRGVMREAVRLFGQSNRDENPFGAVMIEIDHFDRYVDHHGASSATELFKTLALLVEGSSSRPLDFVGRYDEKTLILLLPETSAEGAQKVAQEVLKHVREAAFPFAAAPNHGMVTVSVATNSYEPEEAARSVETLLSELKLGLETAQNSGYDRAIAV